MISKHKFDSLVIALVWAIAAIPGSAMAITVDGIFDAGDGYTDSISLQWYNDHNSIYDMDANMMNTMYYSITDSSLNLFVEVPDFARVMIWTDYEFIEGTDCATDPDNCGGLEQDYLEKYADGSHHDSGGIPSVKMNYSTQTGSEYFLLEGPDLCFGLQDDGGHCKSATTYTDPVNDPTKNDGIYWQTSRHYVLDNGCTTVFCDAYDTTMSLELLMLGLDIGEGQAILDSITSMRLHLSDEARGLPPISAVPVPAAFWLFSTALVGLIGVNRRKSIKA